MKYTQTGLITAAREIVEDATNKTDKVVETLSDLDIIFSRVTVEVADGTRYKVSPGTWHWVRIRGCGVERSHTFYGTDAVRRKAARAYIRKYVQQAWNKQERENNGR